MVPLSSIKQNNYSALVHSEPAAKVASAEKKPANFASIPEAVLKAYILPSLKSANLHALSQTRREYCALATPILAKNMIKELQGKDTNALQVEIARLEEEIKAHNGQIERPLRNTSTCVEWWCDDSTYKCYEQYWCSPCCFTGCLVACIMDSTCLLPCTCQTWRNNVSHEASINEKEKSLEKNKNLLFAIRKKQLELRSMSRA